ncbi:OmpA/MotB domain protein [Emticicia oligotrophica DSM 17448]|uniref:OmpA/MotB domain protein n=1 Tax=Emticicia oligotrophica (strain DSM 17448 / CIP 109782 / MTCC 6937 / GPTSA100-15) TaxID=929562 RepID=A0ABN4AN42_EMTOG|nr:OmpA family protein [Emticicia oligotrophica]AFK03800.1 OmpA/MotB domain protein [Emticicia oligotrophica DSM 17448]
MPKRIIISLIYLITFTFASVAQSSSKVFQKANTQFETLGYAKAIELYEIALRKPKGATDEEILKAKLNLALSYKLVKDYQNAERVYRETLSANPVLKGEDIKAYRHFAQVLTSNSKFLEANQNWQKFNELQEQDKRGIEFIKLNSNREALERNVGSYKIEYVGINSSSADFSPVYYKKGLVFVSGRTENSQIRRVFNWDASSFLDLFYLEDLKALGTESGASAIGSSSQMVTQKNAQPSKKLGTDYYTPPTANDAKTVGRKGTEYITGSKYLDYEEEPSIQTEKFSKNLNSKYHEGPCAFFHDGMKIVFTRNTLIGSGGVLGPKKNGAISRLKLYTADYENNDWRKIKEIPFNSNDYSCAHPTLTIDDKTMYFVSDMPGGYGGTDIWMTRYENDEWSKPQNLGGSINTRGNEMFPFVDERGNLYFSSDGHPGLGDLDIFFVPMSTAAGMPSGKVRNLGAPLNSSRDDFGIITDSERRTGFISSNRKRGGIDDDIYKFTRLGTLYGCREVVVNIFDNDTKKPFDKIRFEYEIKDNVTTRESAITNDIGTIKLCLEADNDFIFLIKQNGYQAESISFSNKDASDYEVSKLDIYLKKEIIIERSKLDKKVEKVDSVSETLVSRRNDNISSSIFRGVVTAGKDSTPIAGVRVRFINQCTGIAQEMTTGADGSYEFKRELNCDYVLESFKENFGKSSETIPKIEEKRSIITSIFKKKKPVVPATGSFFDTKLYKVGDIVKLDNIYYDSDSYKIRSDAARELEKLVRTMQRNPNMIIEIRSHTDTRGNALDNLMLSQRRVNEVVDYLADKGIARARMRGVGKGESEPVNSCGDGVQCTEAEHQRNRRTEFKIISIERK